MGEDDPGPGIGAVANSADVGRAHMHIVVVAGALEDEGLGAGQQSQKALAERRVAGIGQRPSAGLRAKSEALEVGDMLDFGGREPEPGSFHVGAVGDLDVTPLEGGGAGWQPREGQLEQAFCPFLDAGRACDIDILGPVLAPGIEKKKRQTEKVVGMEVTYKDKVDVAGRD